ncbi:MAG: hypothetical protein NWF05_07565 [Candidatus Bathyarchaeota archaeon]|nr:hypothetical protein [Candidatus Bathyarchaeota archaeon]
MTGLKKAAAALLFVFLFLTAYAFPVFATEYHPGVKTGQYVTYGHFIGFGSSDFYGQYDWAKNEVTEVSGDEVTLFSTGLLKNGSPIPENDIQVVWNVATGELNGVTSTEGPLIAANLNRGDLIPPNVYTVNRTETRLYLGVYRTVSIHEVSSSSLLYEASTTYIYDQASGMLFELAVETKSKDPSPVRSGYAFTITDTNIFSPTATSTPIVVPSYSAALSPTASSTPIPTATTTETPSSTPQQNPQFMIPIEYAIVAIAVVIVVAAVLVLKSRKNSQTPPPSNR